MLVHTVRHRSNSTEWQCHSVRNWKSGRKSRQEETTATAPRHPRNGRKPVTEDSTNNERPKLPGRTRAANLERGFPRRAATPQFFKFFENQMDTSLLFFGKDTVGCMNQGLNTSFLWNSCSLRVIQTKLFSNRQTILRKYGGNNDTM